MSFSAQRPATADTATRDNSRHRGESEPSRPIVAVFAALLILLGMAMAAYWACHFDIPTAPAISAWRRTPTGWEKRSSWPTSPAPRDPRLHPVTVAAWLAIAGSLALLALSPEAPHGRGPTPTPLADFSDARDAADSAR